MKLPVLTILRVFHVGTMDIEKKKKGSYEGAGLSVSNCPGAWQRINKGNTYGEVWEIRKDAGVFVDYHEISQEAKEEIIKWGQENELVERCTIYRFSNYSDEIEAEYYEDYTDEAEAKAIAEDIEQEYETDYNGYKATQKLKKLSFQEEFQQCLYPFELLVTSYVEQKVLDVDGIWWEDTYSPMQYSAPRGVIFNSRLKSWEVKKDGEFEEEIDYEKQDILSCEEEYIF